MNSEKWEKLKADCKAISDKDFLAFPALEFQLQLGDRGFILNRYMRWPPAGVFTRDGRKIDISRRDGENCGIFQLCMNTGQSDETKSKTTIAPNGFFSYKNNFIPTWDQRLANIFTVFSRDKKGTIDDCLPEYLVNQSQKLHVCPIAISLMYEPEEVLEAVENKWPYVTVLGLGDGKDIGRHIDYMGDYCYAGTVSSLCASTGPEILEWTYSYNNVSYNVPRWNVAKRENDFYVLNNYRYDVRLKAVSDKGLAEVIIYDGDKGVYRRFLLNGERTFDVTLDLVNNQCRHLVPVVKDIAGGVAVAREIQTESWLNRMYWCGDRCNFGSQPRGHGAGQLHPQPWTTQNGPYDQLLAQWSFPIVSPSVTEVRADFFRRFETAGGYSCMWHTYYRTWPMEEMNIQDTEISWRGIYGGDIFFWEEQWPAALDQIWNWPEPETPFYPENRSDFKEIAGLPKWKAQHNTREIRLLKDVAFQKPFVNALSVSNMYLSGWGSYDFRIGKQRVSGMFPGAGSPELKLSGKVPESGIFAVQVEPEDKGWIWSLTGKNMEYRLSAVDGEFSLEVGWPAAPKQSKKGVVYAQETYKLDGAFTGPKLDTLLKPDGIQPITGRLVSQRLPYTFIPENGACVFHLSEMFLPFKWIHVEVHGLDPHCTAYYTEIKTPKLLLYMPFEDKSASLTRDRSGNNFDGSVTGATWTSSGKFAGAYCFDGIGDRIDTGEDSAFDFVSGDFSVAMWARKKDNTSGYAISKGRSPGIFSWCLFWNHPVSAWQMYTTQGGGVQWGCSLDTWHHIVVTREGSQLKMYGDGVLRDSKSLGGNLSDKATNLTIGAESGGGSHFKGCLDEIRIYGNALSEVQVKALYEMAVDEHEEIGGPWVLGNIRPVGVDPEGIARAVIWRGKKDMDVFMGHPVLCSDKEVFYDAILDSGGGWIIEANNPTDKDRTVDFRMHPAWKGNVRIEKTVTIPAGGRINFKEAPDDGKKTE
ncbi:MAG: LamG domain-containing protein [Kiritimatiellae bacterium]|nr:LamG domain-containing protein [Kiritimatiellia bacterium]